MLSWVSVCPGGLWNVQREWMGERRRGCETPHLGSVCRVRVRCRTDEVTQTQRPEDADVSPVVPTAAPATACPRSCKSVLQVPLDDWFRLRVGEGQCDITEGCVEGMRAGEVCVLKVMPLNEDSMPKITHAGPDCHPDYPEGQVSSRYTLELHSFSPGKESWEMTPGEKWSWVKSHKERGGNRFVKGDVWGAADSYCRAIKLLITLAKRTAGDKDGHGSMAANSEAGGSLTSCVHEETSLTTEVSDQFTLTEKEYHLMKAELHSNLALCQLKLGQPSKARESSSRATNLNPTNAKAWYRLGQASVLVGELNDARRAFGRVLELEPNSASARKALKQLNVQEKELDSKLAQRLSKMFSSAP
ncbi:FK506-binding protein-like [Denticeps clupeoides]|uniref:FK506-binding protein-like n=1 Tax=Denticeps clupeoides TaxID=299321 RepID=A0AAY4AY51_9TELE|nr:FK506-binding protein-like [Denticeps clupeoides]XP_028850403.1 FK506-binding protein-like [Denticeps clupeoides]